MNRHFSIILFFLLTACVAPTTAGPKIGHHEILTEAQSQEAYVKERRAEGIIHGINSGKPIGPRLKLVVPGIIKAATTLCADIGIEPSSCAYEINVVRSNADANGDGTPDSINAYADGKQVFITPAMVQFADQDNELAFILAHEFSHNIMDHVASQKQNTILGALAGLALDVAIASQGYNTQGEFAKMGAQTANLTYSADFEREADYMGLYILARAGYNIHSTPHFWRRMSTENPGAIYTSTSHPSNPERFVFMNKTIAEIDAKKRARQPLMPEFIQRIKNG